MAFGTLCCLRLSNSSNISPKVFRRFRSLWHRKQLAVGTDRRWSVGSSQSGISLLACQSSAEGYRGESDDFRECLQNKAKRVRFALFIKACLALHVFRCHVGSGPTMSWCRGPCVACHPQTWPILFYSTFVQAG